MTKDEFIDHIAASHEPLRRFLTGLCCGNGDLADDIAQDAILKAYLAMNSFKRQSSFRTWLFSIAYHCFVDAAKQNREHVRIEELSNISEEESGHQLSFLTEELILAIEGLSQNEKTVILLFYLEEYSIREIEKITGMPSGTIRSHLSRARAHLRKKLQESQQ